MQEQELPQVSIGRSVPTQVAVQALWPQVTFAPWHAWLPEPHWRSHGPVDEQVTTALLQA
jgi:hypothetical protein